MKKQKINGVGFVAGRWPLRQELDTIVFIHGSGGTNILWHAQVASLAEKFNTIALDLPGHGDSDGLGMERIEDYAKSVSGFIESIDVRMPVICGMSIGGAIVLRLLIDEPDNYKAGIVVNSGAKLKVMPMIFEMIEKDYPGFVKSIYTFGISKQTDPAKLKPITDSMLSCPPEVTLNDFSACDAFDVRENLNEIKKPVLVMAASEDLLTPFKYAQFLTNHIPNAVMTSIENTSHFSPVEKPDDVSQAILAFMKTL